MGTVSLAFVLTITLAKLRGHEMGGETRRASTAPPTPASATTRFESSGGRGVRVGYVHR